MATEMEVVARIAGDASGAVGAFHSASQAAQQFQGQIDKTNAMLVGLGAAIGGVGIAMIKFGKQAFDEAARVSELDVAMVAIGRSTGVGAAKLKEAAAAIKSKGIETAAAQKMAIEYAQGNLNLAQAADVARVAQDLAVISQKNSTDTAMLLTRAIKTGNSMLLKSAGVSRQASEAYAMYAQTLGKSQNDLTATERQQAVINLILDEGAKVAGVYEGAMQEAGKVLRSFPRLFNDMQVAIGGAMVDGFGPMILATYDLVKAFSKAISEGGSLYPIVEALRIVFVEMFEPVVAVIEQMTGFVKGLKLTEDAIPSIAQAIQGLLPLVGALAAGLSALAGKSLLGNLPVIGRFAMMLNPVAIGLTTLIFLTPKLRDQFMGLFRELMKLVPPLLAVAYAVAQAGAEFLEEFIVPIASTLVSLLKPAIEGVNAVFAMFGDSTKDARTLIEVLKTSLVVLTGVYVGLKVVQLAQLAVTKAQIIWDGILTAATFVLILATDGLAAAFAALGVAMTATGIGAIVVVIGLAIGAMILWYQKSVWFRNAIKQILEAIVNFFITLVNSFIILINNFNKVAFGMVNGLIGIYNKIAKITGLPKIEPIEVAQIGLIDKINIKLEETNRILNRNYALMWKIENMQKKENQARLDAMGWLDAYNDKIKEEIENQDSSSGAADKKAEKLKELKDRTLDYVKNALEKAREALEREQTAMEEYAQSVSRAITENLSLSNAYSTVLEQQRLQTEELGRQQAALDAYADRVGDAIYKILSLTGALDSQRKAADELTKAQDAVQKATIGLKTEEERYAERVALAQEKSNEALNDALEAAADQTASEKTKLAAVERYLAAVKNYDKVKADTNGIVQAQNDLAEATTNATKAQQAQMSFLDRLAEQATKASGFARRITELASVGLSKDALDQIIGAGVEAGTTIAEELLAGGTVAVQRTNQLFAQMKEVAETTGMKTAKTFMSVGESIGFDLISAFNAQAEEAKVFAERVKQLTEAGLSKENIAMVLQAGVKAGTAIADYLLVAGEDRIMKANNIVIGLKDVGDSLGVLLGKTFFSAGVTLAQQIVAGLESQLKEVEAALKKLNDLKAAREYMKEVVERADQTSAPLSGLNPKKLIPTSTTSTGESAERLAVTRGVLTEDQALALMSRRGLPMLANGGIVNGPTLAMIGEAGPEAVIPLKNKGGMSSTKIEINVNAGMGANGGDIAQEIVDQLSRWQRRNGSLPLQVI